MSLDPASASLDLAKTVIDIAAPSIAQEQKQSLLNAFKSRIAKIQALSDALAANPLDRAAQLAYGAGVRELLNAAGYTASGVAGVNINTPLDDSDQLLSAVAAFVLLVESNAAQVKP
jgi:hypothetical protein